MRIIVFGGTGWLGHNIVLQLAKTHHEVTVCCRGQKKAFLSEVSGLKMITADKKDENAMKEILAAGYDVVIDTVPTLESIAYVQKYAVGLKHYIHCSSTGGYAPLPFVPCNETAPYDGFEKTSGWMKKAYYDREVMRLFMECGFPATVIRPCYITGPGMVPLDNLGGRRTDYIADVLAEKVLDVPDDGQALLQPIHVIDLATSFCLCVENTRSIGQIYNICLDHAVPLWKYHKLTAQALGRKANLNFMPLEEMVKKYEGKTGITDMRFVATHMCFSIEKAKRDLGYKPHCTPEEAIQETARWAASLIK